MGYRDHREAAGRRVAGCAVITCSDTRTAENDVGGRRIRDLLTGAGHEVKFYTISKDNPDEIGRILDELAARPEVEAILLTGGTGLARRDTTFDVVSRRLVKVISGFGELFRMLSYAEIGSGAMMSRATAGIMPGGAEGRGEEEGRGGQVVFCLPGSPAAVELAMTKLILPELEHLLWELER